MEDTLCKSAVKFVQEQKSKEKKEMFINLIRALAMDNHDEASLLKIQKVDPYLKRDDFRNLLMSGSSEFMKLMPFKKILQELEK